MVIEQILDCFFYRNNAGRKDFTAGTSDSVSTFEINAVSMADEKSKFIVYTLIIVFRTTVS